MDLHSREQRLGRAKLRPGRQRRRTGNIAARLSLAVFDRQTSARKSTGEHMAERDLNILDRVEQSPKRDELRQSDQREGAYCVGDPNMTDAEILFRDWGCEE
jgi:hypothetical protein